MGESLAAVRNDLVLQSDAAPGVLTALFEDQAPKDRLAAVPRVTKLQRSIQKI